MYKPKNHAGFFTTVMKLDEVQRRRYFYFVCVPLRITIGILFIVFADTFGLSVIAALWGALWLMFMIRMKRWEEHSDTPPWWEGLPRIIFRFAFSLMLLSFGLLGAISDKERVRSNEIVGSAVLVDVVHGFVGYTYFFERYIR